MPPKTHSLWLSGDRGGASPEGGCAEQGCQEIPRIPKYHMGVSQGRGVERKRQCREAKKLLIGCFVVEGDMGVFSG